MNNKKQTVALLLTIVLFLSILGPSFASVEVQPTYENRLTVAMEDVFDFMLPIYWDQQEIKQVNRLIFQPLIRENEEGGWELEAATDFTVNEDGTKFTFSMDPKNTFHDGEPVTAHDVVFSYMLVSDPSYHTDHTYATNLKGYNDFRYYNINPSPGEDLTDYFPGVVAIDDYTVEFNFAVGARVNYQATTLEIMPRHYYGAYYTYGDFNPAYDLGSRPMGSGPYQLEKFIDYNELLLTRNPKYIHENDFPIEEILIKEAFLYESIDLFKTGSLDLITIPSTDVFPEDLYLEEDPYRTFIEYPRSGYGYVKTNHEHGPTAELAVRKALYSAFDVDTFNQTYFEGYSKPHFHPYSEYSWAVDDAWVNSLPDYSYNIETAKKTLDDAGWKVGPSGYREKNGEILSLDILAIPDHDVLAALIPLWERDWGQALSIDLNITYHEFESIVDMIIWNSDYYVEEWDMFFLASGIYTDDPHGTVADAFHSRNIGSGGINTSRYQNEEVDNLIDQAGFILDIDKARPLYQEIGKILMEDAAFMPVYANSIFTYYHTKINDLETHGLKDWTRAIRTAYIEGYPPFDEALNQYRISKPGGNRYSTAETIAKEKYHNAETVIIVRGDGPGNAPNVVDALSASGLAGVYNAPILLTHPTRLLDDTRDAIENLGAKEAIIVGGEGAVSLNVEAEIKALGLNTRRLRVEGGDRFSTATEVANDLMKKQPSNTAIVAGGTALVDSLVAGPVAHEYGYPILLVGRNVPKATEEFLIQQGIENLIIVGGSGVVSESVEDQLNALVSGNVKRVSGVNRFETSIAIADEFFSHTKDVVLVNGISFVDAVPASILGDPLLYVRQDRIPDTIKAVLMNKSGVRVVGGTGALSNEVLMEAYMIVTNQ